MNKEFWKEVVDLRKVKRLVLLIQSVVLLMLVGCRTQLTNDIARFTTREDALKASHAAELEELTVKAEAGLYASQYLPDSEQGNILPLARWLGALENNYPGLSAEAKELACWVVFNRVDSGMYPDNMESVLLQKGQFAEYDPDSSVTEENFVIASNQISRWANGDIRPCGEGAVYITVSSEGVELRDQWDEKARCNKWVA